MGLTKVQASGLDLSADWNFTGTVTGTPAGGSMTLIKTLTASSSSSLSFVNGSNDVVLDSTYKAYRFVFKNIHPATNDTYFKFQGSTNGGSSYGVTITTTNFIAEHSEAGTSPALSYVAGDDLAQSTDFQTLCRRVGGENDESCSGILNLYNPSSTTYVKHFISDFNLYQSQNFSLRSLTAGYFNTTSIVNAIQFKFSSGNIDDGQISLYGIN